MEIKEFLSKSGVHFEIHKHTPVFTAQRMAAVEHERGRYVAKPVIVRADGRYLMCVLPASHHLDWAKLKTHLAAQSVELAKESEIADLFPGCQVGAEPPFGNLYGLPTLMDKALERDDHLLFQAGTHEEAIRMSMADYQRLAQPKVVGCSDRPSLRRRLAVLLSRLTDYFAK
jgi:Ala-tRNA(Pro) deacylase